MSQGTRCFADTRGNRMECTTPVTKSNYAMYANLALNDIDLSINFNSNANWNSSGGVALNVSRLYMHDLQVTHMWKNNSNTAAIAEFYILIPRRDQPRWEGDINDAVTSDNCMIYNHAMTYANAFQQDATMYTRWFTDASSSSSAPTPSVGLKIGYNDVNATPFLNPFMTSMFKVKRLRVKGPKGLAAVQTIAPGEIVTYQSNRIKPRLVNYSKYGLSGLHQYRVTTAFAHLKETPIIFMYLRGGVAHSDADKSVVVPSNAWLDYVRKKSWKLTTVSSASRTTLNVIPAPTIAVDDKLVESNSYGGAQVVAEANGDV